MSHPDDKTPDPEQQGSPPPDATTPPPGFPPPPPPPPPGPPPQGAYPPGYQPQTTSGKRVAAGVFGILLGGLGIHRFYLNDPLGGVLRILITLVTCGAGSIIGLIEGIIYLTKSDAEFDQIYIVEKRAWF